MAKISRASALVSIASFGSYAGERAGNDKASTYHACCGQRFGQKEVGESKAK
jgi:hypothetical protein